MAIVTKRFFSKSTGGAGITITGTAATGTLIHRSVTGGSSFDEVWIWAVNTAAASGVKLTVEWAQTTGGTAGQPIEFTVPPESGPYLVVPGWPLNTARQVRAYAGTASVIRTHGYVNRIA